MRYATCFSILAVLVSACGGTETDNPLAEFKRTGCKNHSDTALTFAADEPAAEPLPESSYYDGLYCFDYAYDEDASTIQIDVYNYPSACGRVFAGATARSSEGHLTLSLQPESCEVARCGTCLYDLSFTVTDFDLLGGHMVELVETGCETSAGDQPREIVFFAAGEQLEVSSDASHGTFCRSLAEQPTACDADDECRVDLEQCSAGACEPRLTF